MEEGVSLFKISLRQLISRWNYHYNFSKHRDMSSYRFEKSVTSLRADVWRILVFVLTITCFLHSVYGQEANNYLAPTFQNPPHAGQIELPSNGKILLCEAKGYPEPVYRWLKDGVFLSAQNDTSTLLVFKDLDRNDAGAYQCVASNNAGAIISKKAVLRVAYIVPFSNAVQTDKHALPGEACVIDLPVVDSNPAPHIKWMQQDGTAITPDSLRFRFHISLRNQLILLEVKLTDNGKSYRAEAKNVYIPSMVSHSQTFFLRVPPDSNPGTVLPTIVVPPTHTTAIQGEDTAVTLECVANASPLTYLTLSWFRRLASGLQEIQPQANRYHLSRYRRRLTIEGPTINDTGVYECEARFSHLSGSSASPVTAQANLTIYLRPVLTSSPDTRIQQDVGSEVNLICESSGIPTPSIIWYHNAVPISLPDSPRHTVERRGHLVITEAQTDDSGVYQCFANNKAGSAYAATWLQVLSSTPEIVQAPGNQSVIAGDSATFTCEVTGAPRPTVNWYRVSSQGVVQDITSDDNHFQLLSTQLKLPETITEDSGRYVCNAINSQGQATATAYLTVSVRTVIVRPPQNASAIKGSNAVLQCGVVSDPSVVVTWQWKHRNSQNDINIIPADDQRRSVNNAGSLAIKQVRPADVGIYQCDVTSSGGNDVASAALKVIELPYPPSNVLATLNDDAPRAVHVEWEPGFDGGSDIRYYILQYRMISGVGDTPLPNEGWKVARGDIPRDQRSYTLDGLQPARTYQFSVSAVNDVGEGQLSSPSAAITLPQQPPSGPARGVVGSPRSASSIILQWQEPDVQHWNGDLLGYMMRYKLSGYPDETMTFYNISRKEVNMHELDGLIVFQEYEIAIAAYNSMGVGVYSPYIHVRTQEGKPSVSPSHVEAEALTSTTIQLKWNPPSPQHINGINQGYKIHILRQIENKEEEPAEVVVPSNPANMQSRQVFVLRNMRKFTNYSITLLCFTSKGNGPSSTPVTATTLEDVPGQLGSLEFDNIRDTSLRVFWTPPENINGDLQSYTLSYMRKNDSTTRVEKTFGPKIESYTINELAPTTTYTIEVYCSTRVGPGAALSADIDSGIPPELPTEPRNLAITNIQSSSVLLQFVPGFDGYTSISKWVVEAQTEAHRQARSEDAGWHVVFEVTAPEATALTVSGMRPYRRYRLRLIAENTAGSSEPSEPTRWFETIQAPPSNPPQEVTVLAVNETAIRVRWTPLPSDLWNGEERGYTIRYYMDYEKQKIEDLSIDNENANSHIIGKLEEWTLYNVKVAAFNSVGKSDYSPIAKDTTRESVPSSGPENVTAYAESSTVIHVKWDQVPLMHQNGQIKGYKVHYWSVQAGVLLQERSIESNTVMETRLQGLKKFIMYKIQVLAYTRIGDGVLSIPVVEVKTSEDTPGPPSSIYFPEVTTSTARVVWSTPREPNGIITGYSVAYREKTNPHGPYTYKIGDLGAEARDHYVDTLAGGKFYQFEIIAKTHLGWGEPAEVLVFTAMNRETPESPSKPEISISLIGPRYVTISWVPGVNNGYSPIRNYSIQVEENGEAFIPIPDYIPGDLTTYKVDNLKPNSKYRFNVAAHNDIGQSPYSEPSNQITTSPAAPEQPPRDLQAVPQTTSAILVTWKPPPASSWNSDPIGYQVWYAPLQLQKERTDINYHRETVFYPDTHIHLNKLMKGFSYELKVAAYGTYGLGPFTVPYDIFVGEAAPTAPPQYVMAHTVSSTSIKLTWQSPPQDTHNGDLLGYKVYYWRTYNDDGGEYMRTAGASDEEIELNNLHMYTDYSMYILAFNAAGDGPNITRAVSNRTDEGIPEAPRYLHFSVVDLTSVNVSWMPPEQPNGHIQQYEVSYMQQPDSEGESRHVQVKISGERTFYLATELTQDEWYSFSVRTRTKVDWGKEITSNVTVAPLNGAPGQPRSLYIITEGNSKSFTLAWENGESGSTPIDSYIIQGREINSDLGWKTLLQSNSTQPSVVISFLNLNLGTQYHFRVFARNSLSISHPSEPSEYLRTLSIEEIEEVKYYEQWWFLVIVSLAGVIVIILIVSLLCLTNKGRKREKKYTEPSLPHTTVQLRENGHAPHIPAMTTAEEGEFTTFDMRRSQRNSQRRPPVPMVGATGGGTLTSNRSSTYSTYGRGPPRPSPSSVNYSDEEGKPYGDDDSSLSDKPSDVSDSDNSQVSDDEPEAKGQQPSSFTNHYVNGSVQQSWQRNNNPYNTNAYSYPDSEHDSSQYGVTMNGGHIIMNNLAGSRAPLPGFSSFV